ARRTPCGQVAGEARALRSTTRKTSWTNVSYFAATVNALPGQRRGRRVSGRGLARQAQCSFGEDRALHLGGAGVDRAGTGVQGDLPPAARRLGIRAGVIGAHRLRWALA